MHVVAVSGRKPAAVKPIGGIMCIKYGLGSLLQIDNALLSEVVDRITMGKLQLHSKLWSWPFFYRQDLMRRGRMSGGQSQQSVRLFFRLDPWRCITSALNVRKTNALRNDSIIVNIKKRSARSNRSSRHRVYSFVMPTDLDERRPMLINLFCLFL